ncbi:MAG TPA: response regulator, partial [Burkholderiaceae bacterium]|nr:response regulator [Burkholderiaceae bacterium]
LAPHADETAAPLSGDAKRSIVKAPRRILIADDNADAAMSLAMLLEMNGHETRVVTDGAQAVALVAEFDPHVAILDIAMPVLDGLDAARAIRASAQGEGILLIALSGFGQESDRRRTAEAGMDEHLVKPVDPGQIEQILARHSKRGWRV